MQQETAVLDTASNDLWGDIDSNEHLIRVEQNLAVKKDLLGESYRRLLPQEVDWANAS